MSRFSILFLIVSCCSFLGRLTHTNIYTANNIILKKQPLSTILLCQVYTYTGASDVNRIGKRTGRILFLITFHKQCIKSMNSKISRIFLKKTFQCIILSGLSRDRELSPTCSILKPWSSSLSSSSSLRVYHVIIPRRIKTKPR